jgi:hypothetical protein
VSQGGRNLAALHTYPGVSKLEKEPVMAGIGLVVFTDNGDARLPLTAH